MNELMVYGLIGIAALAVLGLGVKIAINFKGSKKTIMKNIDAGGDVVAGNKTGK
ncbi:hypothetical protein KO527_10770 [Pseudoalteromonas sp. C2R02]|uniref:hypothetical protein n=1 Tax=Pseudoalteromonas sp. C2R02 TaxID=2841565 RepID=UPI001C08A37D|nr:hypothetical protein [Pseudoalteromonas sp. C2R02]MBU2969829.1 hypothetical protein [Pseudoalteromonas sp. C2R02]